MTKKSKKKPIPLSNKKKLANKACILDIEILQHGAVQASTQWIVGGLRQRMVTFGSSSHSDMPIPFSTLPGKVGLFIISKYGVNVILDPRTEGFINRGQEFSDVHELLAPRGALAEIASIESPLHIELATGSRGALRIYGFEIIFKYNKPIKNKKKNIVKGEKLIAFAQPPSNIPLEKKAFWLALACVVCISIPLISWLLKAPHVKYNGILSIPSSMLYKVISPEHYPYLPRFLIDDFDEKNAITQAAFVVSELKHRWDARENNTHYTSNLPLLKYPGPANTKAQSPSQWNSLINTQYDNLNNYKNSPTSARYYKFQNTYPKILATVSGGKYGSLRMRLQQRINEIRATYASMFSLIKTEENFMLDFYKDVLIFNEVENSSILKQPSVVFVGYRAHPEFMTEIARYQTAQYLAFNAPTLNNSTDLAKPILLEKNGLLLANNLDMQNVNISEIESGLTQNAEYSIATKPLPPPVPPKPRIDITKVKAIINSKKEEIKTCYDSLLRRSADTEGTVRIQWKINSQGNPDNPKVIKSTIQDNDFQFCLRARIMNWKFPKPLNGTVVYEYPFTFLLKSR